MLPIPGPGQQDSNSVWVPHSSCAHHKCRLLPVTHTNMASSLSLSLPLCNHEQDSTAAEYGSNWLGSVDLSQPQFKLLVRNPQSLTRTLKDSSCGWEIHNLVGRGRGKDWVYAAHMIVLPSHNACLYWPPVVEWTLHGGKDSRIAGHFPAQTENPPLQRASWIPSNPHHLYYMQLIWVILEFWWLLRLLMDAVCMHSGLLANTISIYFFSGFALAYTH